MVMICMLGQFAGWCWSHRSACIALLLVVTLVAPQPAKAQFLGIDIGVIISALNSIRTALVNVIGGALRIMNETLGQIQGIIGAVQDLFQNTIYPQAAINRARGLISQIMGLYNQIRAIANVNVLSATLPNPRALEQILLSRDPLKIPNVARRFETVYQPLPSTADAAPEARDLIDASDAAAQAAMKRAIAIDAIADQELQAAERMLNELQGAAPGTAAMIGAQGAAWLVRSHAYTQVALADSIRLRSVDLAGQSAELKFNTQYGVTTRQKSGVSLGKR